MTEANWFTIAVAKWGASVDVAKWSNFCLLYFFNSDQSHLSKADQCNNAIILPYAMPKFYLNHLQNYVFRSNGHLHNNHACSSAGAVWIEV